MTCCTHYHPLVEIPLRVRNRPIREVSQIRPRLLPGVEGALTFSSPDTPGCLVYQIKRPGIYARRLGTETRIRRKLSKPPTPGRLPLTFLPVTQLEFARCGTITPEMERVAEREPHLTAEQIRDEVASGRMIIPANKVHLGYQLDPMAIGRASKTKVNANMGASPVSSGTDEEIEKLKWAQQWGADTVMDLSTGGDIDGCRQAIIENSTVPIGTVPIYSMIIARRLEDLDHASILQMLQHQAKQGVDYFTIHAGVLHEHLSLVAQRLIGIVSRGGSLLAKWMLHNKQQNPMYELWDDICEIMREYDVSFSIGDGLRPGGLADGSDRAQLAELCVLGELTERAWKKGVQVMIEGPGHISFDQIEFNMKLQRKLCHGAPFYVLGPIGYGHLPRLRPYHQLYRCDRCRLPRCQHALLRDSQRTPRSAQER